MVHLEKLAGTAALAVAVAAAVLTPIGHAQQPPRPTALPTGNGMIAGRAIDADSGEGVPAASVSLTLTRPVEGTARFMSYLFPAVRTDSQGRFVFTSLPEGSYAAQIFRDGYTSQALNRGLALAAGAQITNFDFRLKRFNTVLGTVRDDAGDAVVGTEVLAFMRTVPQGRPPVLTPLGRGRTDDRGQYRLNNLPAGQYLICACTRDTIPFDAQLLTTLAARPLDLLSLARRAASAGSDAASLDATLRTYAPTFYPNSPLASRAERVQLEKGETRTAMDITVATVRAVRVSGQVIGLPPSSISASSIRLIPVGDIPEAAAITQLPPILVQPDGRFDFSGVPPGNYILDVNAAVGLGSGGPTGAAMAFVGARGSSPPPPAPGRGSGSVTPDQVLWATEAIAVGDADVTGLMIGIQRGFSIRGRIEFAGSAAPPQPNAMRGIVQVAAMEPRPSRPSNYAAQISPDGTFAFGLPPGRYVIPEPPAFAPSWMTARSITVKSVDTTGAAIVVDSDIPDLVITLSDTVLPSLTGTAELSAGDIPEEWAVLVFAADRRLWQQPIVSIRRFQAVRLNALRTFTRSLLPGDYLLALSHGVPLDWMEATALEEFAKRATTVSLVEGDKKTVQVRR